MRACMCGVCGCVGVVCVCFVCGCVCLSVCVCGGITSKIMNTYFFLTIDNISIYRE